VYGEVKNQENQRNNLSKKVFPQQRKTFFKPEIRKPKPKTEKPKPKTFVDAGNKLKASMHPDSRQYEYR
jgi:hypothetical protein